MNSDIGDNIIDSRDIEERIEELESMIGDGLYVEEVDELETLKEFRSDVGGSEWTFGLTLIREEYFEQYTREFAEDIGAIENDAEWPNRCIDWEQAANELQMDYSCAEIQGETYWFLDS